jgi:hypothetical protein
MNILLFKCLIVLASQCDSLADDVVVIDVITLTQNIINLELRDSDQNTQKGATKSAAASE